MLRTIVILLLTLVLFTNALSGKVESLRKDDSLSKTREKNAEEVLKLQNQYKEMIEDKKRKRYEDSHSSARESVRLPMDMDFGDLGADIHMHEKLAAEHMDRYRERAKMERMRRKGSRSESFSAGSEDGFSDERAAYYMSQIRKKASLVAHHLERVGHKFSEEDVHDLNQQIVEYIEKEKIVAAYVQRTADEFNKARDIEDKDKRLQYLEKVKKARDGRQEQEKIAREAAREHFVAIRGRIDPHLYPKDL